MTCNVMVNGCWSLVQLPTAQSAGIKPYGSKINSEEMYLLYVCQFSHTMMHLKIVTIYRIKAGAIIIVYSTQS